MATKLDIRRQLRTYQQQNRGNWRLKGLLLAAFNDHETVAQAWPTTDRHLSESHRANPRRAMQDNYVVPKYRDGKEMSVARSEFSDRELDSKIQRDKYIKRMLLSESETELDTLWREELMDTVIEGARPRQIARESAAVINVDSRRGDIPRGQAQTYADTVAEGAEIPTDEENFETVPYDCDKFAIGFGVTDELIDLAQPDVIERNVRFSGAAVENAINRRWLTTLVNEAGNTHDVNYAGGNTLGVDDVNAAATEVELDDFGPVDSLLMHPRFKKELFDDSNLVYANRAGSDSVVTDRTFNSVMGMNLISASGGTYDPDDNTATWDFDADGEVGGVAYQEEMTGVVIYQDLQTKDFEDPIRDIQGGNVRAYADAITLQPDAVATMTY